ncbi:MAG: AAA family ATPase, partial [Verrucomicrobiales bacterium]|nr:AAA family ATPase [Verrucomicrobiales bacterium]
CFTSSFLREEWIQVIVAHGIESLQDYFKISRAGRRKRLGRKEKQGIWPVFEEYRALLTEHGLRELGDIHRDVRQLLQRERGPRPYRSIVVDESQDLGAEAFRLLRELAPVELGNDLFLVGDAHQRIYGHRVVLSQCGVEVRGRSRRLRVNYRTTEETRRWASRILAGTSIDDMDGGLDDDKAYRSLTHGAAPKVQSFKTLKDEHVAIVQHVEALTESEHNLPEGICLVARTGRLVESYQKALQEAGFSTYLVKHGETDDQSKKGIRVATMHRVKGLEFDHLILAGLSEGALPPHSVDADEMDDVILRERCLVHVAATRARKTIFVTCHGRFASILEPSV